jgi:hypothetical protein
MNQTTTTHKNDWEAIERDYRAGLLSLREMSSAHGVSHVTIKKRADREGWTRSLQPKIMARTEEIMARAEEIVEQGATKEIAVALARDESEAAHCELMARDDDLIEANSRRIAAVRMGHRKQITRMAGLSMTLLGELETQTIELASLEKLGELMRNPDETGMDRLNDIYKRVISTPGRIDSMKKLSDTMKTVVSMEREAYSMNAQPVDPTQANPMVILLTEMKRSHLPIVYEVPRDDSL